MGPSNARRRPLLTVETGAGVLSAVRDIGRIGDEQLWKIGEALETARGRSPARAPNILRSHDKLTCGSVRLDLQFAIAGRALATAQEHRWQEETQASASRVPRSI